MSLSAQEMSKFQKVVTFTNISEEPFIHTHCFGDTPPETYRFEPGESRILPFVIADFLAKHLARKILLGQAKSQDPRDRRRLWGQEDEARLKGEILGEVSSAPTPRVLSKQEIIREQIKQLNPEDEEIVNPSEDGEVETKASIIEALKEKGERVDVRRNKAELKEQLSKITLA